jgi:hypothetical protein
MLATRIKKRPYWFVAWLVVMLLIGGAGWTFVRGISFCSPAMIIFLSNGQIASWLLNKDAPPDWRGFTVYQNTFQVRRGFLKKLHLVFSLPRKEGGWLVVPLGSPMLILISFASWRFWRRLSYPLGHCQSCGYNLTGNESGKCPECGTLARPNQ